MERPEFTALVDLTTVATVDHAASITAAATGYLSALRERGWEDEERTVPASRRFDAAITTAIRDAPEYEVTQLIRTYAFTLALEVGDGMPGPIPNVVLEAGSSTGQMARNLERLHAAIVEQAVDCVLCDHPHRGRECDGTVQVGTSDGSSEDKGCPCDQFVHPDDICENCHGNGRIPDPQMGHRRCDACARAGYILTELSR